MGWISKRCQEAGSSIGGNPRKCRETNRYPLRMIAAVLRHSEGIFDPSRVLFECGHDGDAWGIYRGRCKKCPARQEAAK